MNSLKRKLKTFFYRLGMNIWPCIRGGGGKVVFLADDFTKLVVRLKLNWRTWNYVGTIYGGSMYASTDPFYMLMLIRILGDDYVVWDKGCTLRFVRPAKKTIEAEFHVTPEMLSDVKSKVASSGECTVIWPIAFKDADGVVYSTFDKSIYVATKEFYKQKLRAKAGARAQSSARA